MWGVLLRVVLAGSGTRNMKESKKLLVVQINLETSWETFNDSVESVLAQRALNNHLLKPCTQNYAQNREKLKKNLGSPVSRIVSYADDVVILVKGKLLSTISDLETALGKLSLLAKIRDWMLILVKRYWYYLPEVNEADFNLELNRQNIKY
ncbi:hypothetical protein FF38_08004 [Lucilia cuprina]|uniref:Uncharacterized protein n=1 Tax=Lucilia cuprina TaxID=7375 RepID=A0A0L0CDJ1_LUCCU|nr:hypothetical protein FF38_08004 [Lucilia cuprina]